MAVKKSKMIERFKELFPKVNLSKERLNTLMDKLSKKPEDDADDAAIDEIINDYNDLVDFEQIAKDDDRVRKSEADKAKLQKELSKKNNGGEGGAADEDDEDDDDLEDAPAWAKKMIKDNKSLRKEITEIKTGKVTDTKRAEAEKLFSKSEHLKNMDESIRNKWLDRIDTSSETPLEDQVSGLEEEYSTLVQNSTDSNSFAGGAGSGGADGAPDQKEVDGVVDKMRV